MDMTYTDKLAERIQRAYHAGELAGAIDSYDALRKQLLDIPKKSFLSVTELIGVCTTAIEILKQSRLDYSAQCKIQDAEVRISQENPDVP